MYIFPVLPKRNSDFGFVLSEQEDEEEKDVVYSERVLALSAATAAFLSMVVGFVFGVAVTKMCSGNNNNSYSDNCNNNNTDHQEKGAMQIYQ